jgi:rubrerythrin
VKKYKCNVCGDNGYIKLPDNNPELFGNLLETKSCPACKNKNYEI